MDGSPRHRRRWLAPAALLLAAGLFSLTALTPAAPGGEEVSADAGPPPSWLLPLDDAYIFVRFAQQVARGRGLRWTDELSSGVTSPAFLALVLPGQWLAGDLAGWSRWSRWMGLLTLWALGLACLRLLRAVPLPGAWPLAGALAVVVSGPVGFGALAGMESALNAAAIALACALWCEASWGRPGAEPAPGSAARALAAAAVLPLFRPENSLLSGLACLAVAAGLGPPVKRRLAPLVLMPGVALAALNWAMTGESKPAGAIVKSITEYAFLDPGTFAAAYLFNLLHRVLPTYAGATPPILPGPIGWLALATAATVPFVARLHRRREARALSLVAAVWLALALLAPLSSMVHWQQMRHHHAGLVLAWLLAVAGLALGLERLAAARAWGARWRWGAWLLPVLMLTGLPYWARTYDATRREIHRRHGPAARWLAAQTAKPALMLNDAGLLAVAHDGPAVDVIGLGSPGFGHPHRHGAGAVAETLARHPLRPEVAAVNLDVFDLPMLLGRPLLPRPVREGDTVLAEVRAPLLEHTALPGYGLDFAYLPDEKRRAVRWSRRPSSLEPSFAVVLPAPGAGETLHGCRPVPEAVRWRTSAAGAGHRVLVGAPPGRESEVALIAGRAGAASGEPLARGRVAAGSWAALEARAPAGERVISLVRLSGGLPCVESVGFTTPGS